MTRIGRLGYVCARAGIAVAETTSKKTMKVVNARGQGARANGNWKFMQLRTPHYPRSAECVSVGKERAGARAGSNCRQATQSQSQKNAVPTADGRNRACITEQTASQSRSKRDPEAMLFLQQPELVNLGYQRRAGRQHFRQPGVERRRRVFRQHESASDHVVDREQQREIIARKAAV